MEPATTSDRLNGWKEVASYLGKSVRTVQRWEHEYGLPIRRVGRDGGEIVFGYRSELDAWTRAGGPQSGAGTPPEKALEAQNAGLPIPSIAPTLATITKDASPADAGRAVRWRSLVAMAAILLLGAAGFLFLRPPGNPVAYRNEGTELLTVGIDGEVLWRKHVGFVPNRERKPGAERVLLADIDGDGRNEVLLNPSTERREDSPGVIVYNADGRERFRYRPDDRAVFGGTAYSPPWLGHRLTVLPNPDGTHSIWAVFIHGLEFPTLVVQLSATGELRSKFWSNGYVEHVNVVRWGSRSVVVLGGTNNESRGASLAVYEYGRSQGTAPAETLKYRCMTCPAASPDVFLVFPRRCVSLALNQNATIWETWVDDEEMLHVGVVEGPRASVGEGPTGWYSVATDATLRAVEFGGLGHAHKLFEREGVLDHPFDSREMSSAFPVRRWRDSGFVDLAPVLVSMQ